MITLRLRHELSVRAVGRALLVALAGAWVVVLNNARIGDNVPGHVGYSWFHVPREARLLETGLLLAVFGVLQPRLLRSRIRLIDWLTLAFIAVALAGVWRMPTFLSSQMQGIYVLVAPLLVFAVACEAAPTRRVVTGLIAGLSAFLVGSIGVGLLVQLPAVGVKGDWVHGYFSDAHAFGSYLAIASCTMFTLFLEEGGAGFGLGGAALFLLSYFPANEKVIVLNALWIALGTAARLIRRPTGWRGLAAAGALAAGAVFLASAGTPDQQEFIRTDLLRGRAVTEVGPVKAWIYAWRAVEDVPGTMVAGLGPGNFAGLAAARVAQDRPASLGVLSRAAREVLAQAPTVAGGAVAWVTNTWSNVLAEYGLLGLGLFVLALVAIVVPIARWKPPLGYDRRIRTLFFATLAVVLWQGAVSPYTNWAEPVLSYPMMVLAAYCHGRLPVPEAR